MGNTRRTIAAWTESRRVAALLLGLLCLAGIATRAVAQTVPLERIVAIVDDDIVLASEYQSRLAQVMQNLKRQNPQEVPPDEVVARQVLDRLIVDRIQLQMADRAGVKISDAQLNEAMTNMANQNGMGLEQFRASVESQGQSWALLREQVRQEMVITRVQQGNLRSRVQVTEQEVDDFLKSEEGQKRTAAAYHIAHLLLPLPKDTTLEDEQAAHSYLDALRPKLLGEGAFENFVSSPDRSRYAFTGGDLGWRLEGDLPGIFASVVPGLGSGGVSEPVRSPSGLHLVKLLAKRGGSGEETRQTLTRHILIKPSEIRTEEQAHALAESLRARIVGGEDFAKVAKANSDDIGSQQEGGSLGWVSAGQMVPEFERVMDETADGEVSPVFRSQYGWHILQVQERRTQDLSTEMRRNQARGILYAQKYDEELAIWLQKIRDEAFVEIKI